MSRQDANAAFANTSFLYGGNASYIEDLYARYEDNPETVDAEWQAFFQGLKDSRDDVAKIARGPSWRKRNWPQPERGDLTAALEASNSAPPRCSRRRAIPSTR
jgi:2-oxoglutarate dehydrogenase E1 component